MDRVSDIFIYNRFLKEFFYSVFKKVYISKMKPSTRSWNITARLVQGRLQDVQTKSFGDYGGRFLHEDC